jgi:hypothetical protein
MDKQQKIDKEKFKQIFKDHFAEFQKQNPRYNNDYYTEVIEKMIGCAEKDSGYAKYRCMDCGEEMILCEIWVPEYGKIYDELEEIGSGKYDPIEFEEKSGGRNTERDGTSLWRRTNILQVSLW